MNRGYTLIELIVSVTIVVLLSGLGIASFTKYRDRRVVALAAQETATILRKVQAKASAIDVPPGCGSIIDYTVSLGSNISVMVNCVVGGPFTSATYGELGKLNYSLPSGIVLSTMPVSVTSIVFDSRVGTSTPVQIRLCGNNIRYTIEINSFGVVGLPIYAGSC
jgi:prepilin-type N-terminal cleavage/methylation domain-containing protein